MNSKNILVNRRGILIIVFILFVILMAILGKKDKPKISVKNINNDEITQEEKIISEIVLADITKNGSNKNAYISLTIDVNGDTANVDIGLSWDGPGLCAGMNFKLKKVNDTWKIYSRDDTYAC